MSRPADPHARIALLSAAEAVFAEHGVDAAKVEAIARRANVSKGAFYLHFDSKEHALHAVVESFLARCEAVLHQPCDEAELPDDPGELMAFCAERDVEVFEYFWQNRAILAILGSCQGPHLHLVEAFRKDVELRTQAWVEVLMQRGVVRDDLESSIVSTLICGAYHELVHKLVGSPKKPPIHRWVQQTQDTFFRGLGTPAVNAALARRRAAETSAARRVSDSSVKISRSRAKTGTA